MYLGEERIDRHLGIIASCIRTVPALVIIAPVVQAVGRIQQHSLRSGINAARRRNSGIKRYGDIHVEFALYLLRRIIFIVQDNDSKRNLLPVFSYKSFEIGNVKAGTGAVRVKEMQEYRFAAGNG